jgi:uncharacterized protein involved in exopolysaccharide biosynthesis
MSHSEEYDMALQSRSTTAPSLGLIIRALWGARYLIAAITSVFAAASVLLALWLPNVYSSSVLLAPAESSSGGLSSMISRYGGLASLAGISLPEGEATKATLGIEVLKSRSFVTRFIEKHDLLVPLMASSSWDPVQNRLQYDPDIYDSESGEWVRDVSPPHKPKPSMQEAYEEWGDIFYVFQDRETGYIRVSIDHYSPFLAQQWVTWLVEEVNDVIRNQDVVEAEKSIAYLEQQIKTTSLAELQATLFELIQTQTETIMLAQVRPEYVFKTIDPAIVPEEQISPKRALICVAGTILGGFLGCGWVLLRMALRRGK